VCLILGGALIFLALRGVLLSLMCWRCRREGPGALEVLIVAALFLSFLVAGCP